MKSTWPRSSPSTASAPACCASMRWKVATPSTRPTLLPSERALRDELAADLWREPCQRCGHRRCADALWSAPEALADDLATLIKPLPLLPPVPAGSRPTIRAAHALAAHQFAAAYRQHGEAFLGERLCGGRDQGAQRQQLQAGLAGAAGRAAAPLGGRGRVRARRWMPTRSGCAADAPKNSPRAPTRPTRARRRSRRCSTRWRVYLAAADALAQWQRGAGHRLPARACATRPARAWPSSSGSAACRPTTT